jgi:hypothetical protein
MSFAVWIVPQQSFSTAPDFGAFPELMVAEHHAITAPPTSKPSEEGSSDGIIM